MPTRKAEALGFGTAWLGLGRRMLPDLTLVERCLTYGVPRLSSTNTGAGPLGYYQIVQTPSYVVLFLEAIHEARVITLDGRPREIIAVLPDSFRFLDRKADDTLS